MTLLDGNRRYVSARPRHPHQDAAHRRDIATGQHPFAVILGCADSRVPPEIVFDVGLGDVFVLRSAGNIVDEAILGSLEYAVAEFHVPLILVLGHARCGAVRAAVDVEAHLAGEPTAHIGAVVQAIRPAVRAASALQTTPGAPNDDPMDRAVRANVALVVDRLRADELLLAPAIRAGHLAVVGTYYDLEDGVVSVIVP
jgi:carbonic anhydrase